MRLGLALVALAAWMSCTTTLMAAPAEQPRFQDGSGNVLETLPLEFTEASVQIVHGIAAVKLTQTFANRAEQPIEAVYLFPGSAQSTVRGLIMTVGDRRIQAQIKKTHAAQRTYDAAKHAGRATSLLKEVRVGTYELNVANIMPGERIKVEVDYIEHLHPENGVYRLVLPNTFGVSRYGERRGVEDHLSRRESEADAVVKDAYFVSARVASGVPIEQVSSPSHAIISTRLSANEFEVLLDPADRRALNRDFELVYELSGKEVQSGLSLYERDGEGWFMWTMDSPRQVGNAMIPPREFIFVLDVSGSMHGHPLKTAKELMRTLAGVLRPTDYLNALTFAGGSELLSEQSLGATQATVDRLLEFVDQASSGGGTELLPALQRAYALPKVAAARTVVVVTDGGIGTTYESARLIRDSNGGVGTFVFGVGSWLDRPILNKLAQAGHSAPLMVNDIDPDRRADAIADFRAYVDRPLLSLITLDFDGMQVADVHPQVVPMLYAARPLTVFGRYQPPARGRLIARGLGARGAFERQIEVGAYRPDPHADAVAFIWARRQIDRLLLDGAEEHRAQIEQIGLDYGVLTPYTSFVAVDQVVQNRSGELDTVQQPSAQREVAATDSGPIPPRPPAPPAPPPPADARTTPPSSYATGDLTEVLQQLPALGSAAWQALADRAVGSAVADCIEKRLAGRSLRATARGWRENGVTDSAAVIRIRRGGQAWRILAERSAAFQQFSALSGEVRIRIGEQTLLISDSGFDHFPQRQLEAIAASLRQPATDSRSECDG